MTHPLKTLFRKRAPFRLALAVGSMLAVVSGCGIWESLPHDRAMRSRWPVTSYTVFEKDLASRSIIQARVSYLDNGTQEIYYVKSGLRNGLMSFVPPREDVVSALNAQGATVYVSPSPVQTIIASNPLGRLLLEGAMVLGLSLAASMLLSGRASRLAKVGGRVSGDAFFTVIKPDDIEVGLKDVAGIEDIRPVVADTVDFLTNPYRYSRLGGTMRRGLMLAGPPGVGKTMLAKAIAREGRVPFISVSASSFCEMYVGVGPARVRKLREFARRHAPCIVFIDELETLCAARGRSMNGEERDATLNELLVCMDGLERLDNVLFIGATNRPDMLDPAVQRPGRFGLPLNIGLPARRERVDILRAAVGRLNIRLDPELDLDVIAQGTVGFTGDQLTSTLNVAAVSASKSGQEKVNLEDILEARDVVKFGTPRPSMISGMNDADILRTAAHEAGHAVLALALSREAKIEKATILPRGSSLGMVILSQQNEGLNISYDECMSYMAIALGGYAAESLTSSENVTSGAEEDLRLANRRARQMVARWGMGDLGPQHLPTDDDFYLTSGSEKMRRAFEDSVGSLIHTARTQAIQILTLNKSALRQLTLALIEHETLTGAEVSDLVGVLIERQPPHRATDIDLI